jgi:glycosyltransferase involved in cell wall biosynthesis
MNPLFHFIKFGAKEGRSPHPLFDPSWYLAQHSDVAEAGVNPLIHYLRHGGTEGRDPIPEFDSDWYLEQNPDVASAEINPLMHYVMHGAEEGRNPNQNFDTDWYHSKHPEVAELGANPLTHYLLKGKPNDRVEYFRTEAKRRRFVSFDADLDEATRNALRDRYSASRNAQNRLVSIVTPTYNRSALIGPAIQSVIDQTHSTWELYVVDDGSNDDTANIVAAFTDDKRVKYIKQERGGVCRARNTALDLAQGDLIAFLDSDNAWDREYLALMVAGFEHSDIELAYSGLRLLQDGEVIGYRGDTFDYAECLNSNYVDLNIMMARRSVIGSIRFDESIRRMNDWDFLLNISANRKVEYFPFVGATYSFHERPDQISQSEPQIYKKLIQKRHNERRSDGSLMNTRTAFAKAQLDFALLLAAPREKRDEWGDYHFGVGIAQALERRGHKARLYYHQEEVTGAPPDIAISLRGLTEHAFPAGAVKVIWSISHPDLLTWQQIHDCDLLFCASLTWAQMVRWGGKPHAYSLLQCTDRARFYPLPDLSDRDDRVLFVGNSRKADRAIVTQAAAAGLNLHVYGTHWKGRIPDNMIKGEYLPNEELSASYATAGVVLNDHWPSMKDFGYISNRVFDVAASGGRLVSDHLPSIRRVFGDKVATLHDPAEVSRVAAHENAHTHDQDGLALGTWVHEYHSFDNRVEDILRRIEEFALTTPREAAESVRASMQPARIKSPSTTAPAPQHLGKVRELRVGIIPQLSRTAMTSSAYVRLVQPLTSELDGYAIELVRLDSQANRIRDLDAVIVSRTAFDSRDAAESFVERARARGLPLVVDIDDAFHLMDESHPEFEAYRPRLEALDLMLSAANEIWCSTSPLQNSLKERFEQTVLIPNSIDPRLWQTYRHTENEPTREGGRKLELLYAGSATHGNDLAMITPVLDELARELPIRLTVVGIDPNVPSRPWIRRLSPGVNSIYPRFAPWLRRHAALFDIGIAPLTDAPFNKYKSDLKILEYVAMGLVTVASASQPYLDSPAIDNDMLCSSSDDWKKQLRSYVTEPDELQRNKTLITDRREYLWQERSAGGIGSLIAARLCALADRSASLY